MTEYSFINAWTDVKLGRYRFVMCYWGGKPSSEKDEKSPVVIEGAAIILFSSLESDEKPLYLILVHPFQPQKQLRRR